MVQDSQDDEHIAALRRKPLHMSSPPPTVSAMAAQLEQDGFLHLPGCLSPEETQRLRARSDWLEQLCLSDTPPRIQPGNSISADGHSMHVVNAMHYHSDFLIPIDMYPTLPVAEAALGSGVSAQSPHRYFDSTQF